MALTMCIRQQFVTVIIICTVGMKAATQCQAALVWNVETGFPKYKGFNLTFEGQPGLDQVEATWWEQRTLGGTMSGAKTLW